MPGPSPTCHRSARRAALLLSALFFATSAHAQGAHWPRQFPSPSGNFIVYQPQPEAMRGDTLTARAAFSLLKSGEDAATFGVLWFQARVRIDRDSSTVAESDLDVTNVRLPGATDAEAKRYEHLVEAEATGWDLSGSLDQLQAGLAASAKERLSVENLAHTPPRVLFSTKRALLVTFDGPPQLEAIDSLPLQRVVNTPYAVVFDPSSASYYLNGANLWYRASDPLGPWALEPRPPAAVVSVVPPDTSSSDQVAGTPPVIVVATEPSELIVTDGEPLLEPLVGDRLFYVTNTESDVLRDAKSGTVYVLLSGRWYSAHSLDDPWVYVPSDQLPESFGQIPLASPKGNLLASVAGTDEADDAVADNQIPQTSSIQRADSGAVVEWDGPPQFESVAGTDLRYGANTDAQVIAAQGRYFLCDQGVWYVAGDPNGPWSVSDVRPEGLDDLPPSCPVYNLRYVEIYGITADAVTVGYLPGYLGYYPCRGTVVYGTGYRYSPWRSGHRYYARPWTWGFLARYNPWFSRWSFGLSYESGFLRVGMRWHHQRHSGSSRGAPWLGAGGFHRPLIGENHAMLRTRTVRYKTRAADSTPANLYTRAENFKRRASALDPDVRTRRTGAGRPAPVPDDVFAGQDGKVYQRGSDGSWRVRQGSRWMPTPMPATPAPPVVPVGGRDDASARSRMRGSGQRPGTQPVIAPVTSPVTSTLPPVRQPNPVQPPTPSPTLAPPVESAPRPEPVRAPVQPVQPAPQPAQPATPPQGDSSPGSLERDFRARQRTSPEAPAARAPEAPKPAVAPAPAARPPQAPKPAAAPAKKDAPGRREK